MNYKATATIRNKAGKELVWKKLVWAGEASSPREAMEHARGALKQLVISTQGADTIALNLSDEKGGLTTSTEYAEDFTIGYGASAVGSSALMNDAVEHGLTPEQLYAAQKALQNRAVEAMPNVAEKLASKAADPFADFFGDGYKPKTKSEEELSEEPMVSLPGGLWPEQEKMLKDILNRPPGRPYPHDFKGVPPVDQHAQTTGPRQYGKSPVQDMLEQLRETHREFQQATGRQVHSVVMGDQAYELAREQVSKQYGMQIAPGSPFTYDGVEIHKAPGASAPPMQIVPKPRASAMGRKIHDALDQARADYINGKLNAEQFKKFARQDYDLARGVIYSGDVEFIMDEAASIPADKFKKLMDTFKGEGNWKTIKPGDAPIDVKFYGVDTADIEMRAMVNEEIKSGRMDDWLKKNLS